LALLVANGWVKMIVGKSDRLPKKNKD